MKRKTFIFLVLSIFAFALGGCEYKHTHKYSNDWSYNDLEHWHEATCVHVDEKTDVEEHSFQIVSTIAPTYEEDGYSVYECECGYQKTEIGESKLEHNYYNTLSYDDEYHWYACIDSGYESLRKDESKHKDQLKQEVLPTFEEDGYCIYECECGYQKTEIGESASNHNYSDTLSYDDEHHWYACVDSGYESLRKDEAEHDCKLEQEVAPTFEEDGYSIYECECGYQRIEVVCQNE